VTRSRILWAALAALYLDFRLWYDGGGGRVRLEEFARRDAADVAPGYGLAFPAGAGAPEAAQGDRHGPRARPAAAPVGRSRPVLPMVMRGLPVPRARQLYITLDTKREAEDAGVASGRVADPVGRPVERCFSLYPFARSRGRAAELLRSFTQAAFAEGVDTAATPGYATWWSAPDSPGATRSRTSMARAGAGSSRRTASSSSLGLWGVPSFRLLGRDGEPDYSSWGQDRLWRVEQEIRPRLS
jgi:2-hydroxychromene-2-carboxylate isomerase